MNAKKLSKRIIASVVTMMLVLGCFVIPAATSVKAVDGIKVVFHYLRDDGDYTDWGLWAWGEGGGDTYNGDSATSGFMFTDNGDAKGAETTVVASGVNTLGFIVRLGDWKAKDPDPNRYLDLSSVVAGTVHVYCVTGQEAFDVDMSEAVLGLKLKSAEATDKKTVKAVFGVDPGTEVIDRENFIITGSDNKTVDVFAVDVAGTEATLTLTRELDFRKSYTIAYKAGPIRLKTPEFFSTDEFESQYTYEGNDLGATYTPAQTSFRVWAPSAKKVTLNLYTAGNGGEPYVTYDMVRDVKGTWTANVGGDLNGVYYTYTADFGLYTNKDIVDPYARTVGVNGKRGMVIDLDTTDPEGWDQDKRHTYGNLTDMTIYELHIRDFSTYEDSGITNVGKYIAFTEEGTTTSEGIATGIDHLKELGITTVHILPSYDYGSVDETKLNRDQFNWGYDPVNYNSPEGSYSTDPYHGEVRVNEYKQMVKALHDAGIGVVMDVVYNHTYNTNYCFNQLVPGYFYRPDQNTSGCGNDVATERSMVSKFIVDSVAYWASEYHLDGFRFDLMGILDVDTMNAVRAALDEIDPDIIVYGEGWDMSSKPTKDGVLMANYHNAALTPGVAYFSDTVRDGIRGHVFTDTQPGYIGKGAEIDKIKDGIVYTSSWCPSPEQIINYESCHDNKTVWDRLADTNPDVIVDPKPGRQETRVEFTEAQRIAANKMGAAIVFTSQGVPFMMSGEEFLRSKPKGDGTTEHNSHASPDSVNLLDYSRIGTYSDFYNYYKGLIKMRAAFSELRMTDAARVSDTLSFVEDEELSKKVIVYAINGSLGANAAAGEKAHDMLVAFNPTLEDVTVKLPEGSWSVVANGEAAGDAVLSVEQDTLVVPTLTAAVLVKDYAGPADDVYELEDYQTKVCAYGSFGDPETVEISVTEDAPSVDGAVAQYTVTITKDGSPVSDSSYEVRIPYAYGYDAVLVTDNGTADARATYDTEKGAYVLNTTGPVTVAFLERTSSYVAPTYTPVTEYTLTDTTYGITLTGLFEQKNPLLYASYALDGPAIPVAAYEIAVYNDDGIASFDGYTDYTITIPAEQDNLYVVRGDGEELDSTYENGAYTIVVNNPYGVFQLKQKYDEESSEEESKVESSEEESKVESSEEESKVESSQEESKTESSVEESKTESQTESQTESSAEESKTESSQQESTIVVPGGDNVKTGDQSAAMMVVMIVLAGAAAAVAFASKKSKKAE